jgi:LPXTG-motif cell wall-anchored protein
VPTTPTPIPPTATSEPGPSPTPAIPTPVPAAPTEPPQPQRLPTTGAESRPLLLLALAAGLVLTALGILLRRYEWHQAGEQR